MIHAGVTGDERKKAFVVGQRHALPDLIYTFVMTLWLTPGASKVSSIPDSHTVAISNKPTILTITYSFIRLR